MKPIERVEKLLEERDMTWADLSRLLETTQQRVYNWRTRGLPQKEVINVARALRVSAEWLATGEGKPWPDNPFNRLATDPDRFYQEQQEALRHDGEMERLRIEAEEAEEAEQPDPIADEIVAMLTDKEIPNSSRNLMQFANNLGDFSEREILWTFMASLRAMRRKHESKVITQRYKLSKSRAEAARYKKTLENVREAIKSDGPCEQTLAEVKRVMDDDFPEPRIHPLNIF